MRRCRNMLGDAKFLFYIFCTLIFVLTSVEAKKIQHIECPPFPHISLDHGNITSLGNQKLLFQCHQGYFLASPRQVRCWKGNWTNTQPPRCIKKPGYCDDPPPVANAQIIGDDRSAGSSVLYFCHEGYVMLGEDKRTCLKGARWSGLTPNCMEENEPLQNIAERMRNDFVEEIGSYSTDGVVAEGRLLDSASTKLGLELVVLFDRSSSVGPEDFKIGKDFIKFLFQEFGVRNGENPTGTRAAVLTFGTEVDMVFNVHNASITSPEAANEALDKVEPNGGGTNMEGALLDILGVIPFLREGAKKAIFLITDGEPNIGSSGITPEDVAIQLKREYDFEIFTVGIGKGINRKLLSDLASEPLVSHVFVLDKYSDLIKIMKIIKDRPPEVPVISPARCGYIEQERNYLKRWPWLAAIYASTDSQHTPSKQRFCSGALICSQWIITAASCFFNVRRNNESEVNIQQNTEAVFITMGERNLINDETSQLNFYASEVKIHPDFKPESDLLHNLALLKLNIKAPVDRFRPVCLPTTDKVVPLHEDLNINASIAGWGLPPQWNSRVDINAGTVKFELSASPVALSSKSECSRYGGQHDGIFCAGGAHTCKGDLGSPIVALDPATNIHHTLGVLSRRSACLQSNNQYSDLTKYIDWINFQTNNCYLAHSEA